MIEAESLTIEMEKGFGDARSFEQRTCYQRSVVESGFVLSVRPSQKPLISGIRKGLGDRYYEEYNFLFRDGYSLYT